MHVDVAVVGGGPAGLAAAAALQVATSGSKEIHVFEKTSMKARGAAILVGANGLKALHAISPSLLDTMVANATKLEAAGGAHQLLDEHMQPVHLMTCSRQSGQSAGDDCCPGLSGCSIMRGSCCSWAWKRSYPTSTATSFKSWVLLPLTCCPDTCCACNAGYNRPLQLCYWGAHRDQQDAQ